MVVGQVTVCHLLGNVAKGESTGLGALPRPDIQVTDGGLKPSSQHSVSCRAGGGAVASKRRRYSAQERRELWERWRRGESVSEIARALDRGPGAVDRVLRKRGGLPPPERRRSRLALTLAEREEISRGIAAGASARAIASRLQRAPSTVTRELGRHGGRGGYRAAEAELRAWEPGGRPQRCKLAGNPRLAALVAAKLAEQWSPEQIAGWLRLRFPEDETMRVSHETIYLTLFIQARVALT